MDLKVSLIICVLAFLPRSECLRNVSVEVLELKEYLEESRIHIEQTVSLMREDFRRQLDTITKDLGYLKRRESKFKLFMEVMHEMF